MYIRLAGLHIMWWIQIFGWGNSICFSLSNILRLFLRWRRTKSIAKLDEGARMAGLPLDPPLSLSRSSRDNNTWLGLKIDPQAGLE